MPTEQQVNQVGANVAFGVIQWAINLAQSIFKFPFKPWTKQAILTFLSDQTGLPQNTVSLADEGFYTAEWSEWSKYINSPMPNKIKDYVTDTFDCENFGFWMTCFAGLCTGLNTVGTAFGGIYNPTNNTWLFNHGFNMILATENGVLGLWLFEPQTKQWKKWAKGQKNILPVQSTQSWEYRPTWLIYY